MKTAVYPGSFDPITMGHMDIIARSAKVFDRVVVAVLHNVEKKGLFTKEERVEMIAQLLAKYDNIEVKSFEGLLIDFMKEVNATVIIKGLRMISDFDYEMQMAQMNHHISQGTVETMMMMTNTKYSFLSSSSIRELLHFNGEIRGLVPEEIVDKLYQRAGVVRRG